MHNRARSWVGLATILSFAITTTAGAQPAGDSRWTLYGVGDSLTHGTMDATNNAIHTNAAFLQLVANSMESVVSLRFSQPFFDFEENRLPPYRLPTNFAVDGADIFTIEGLEYFKRVGANQTTVNESYLSEQLLPELLNDNYDRVLYPINLFAGKAVSQVGAAEWSFSLNAAIPFPRNELVVYWIGNNDSSLATLGNGGSNPTFAAIPFRESRSELPFLLVAIGELAQRAGEISFAPYTASAIERNLTDTFDFQSQAERTLNRLADAPLAAGTRRDIFVLTLPYYTAVGYLVDSEDLEFYLRKIDPAYTVPPTFARVAPPGQPITDPFAGDRVSLLTFGFMYVLLSTGSTIAEVNAVLEQNGQQQDGLVLSEAESQTIMGRIDEYNLALANQVASMGDRVHLVDTGGFLIDALTGQSPIVVGGKTLSRKWVRGSALSLDGVHPGYTGQAAIANFLLQHINAELGLGAPLHDLDQILTTDPYVDGDGDGFAPGPDHPATATTELLYLLRDPDDANPSAEPVLPANVWSLLSNAILDAVLRTPTGRTEADLLGLTDLPLDQWPAAGKPTTKRSTLETR